MAAINISLNAKIDEVVARRNKARAEWIVDSGNHLKFIKLHEIHMEYKKLVEQVLSRSTC